MADLQNPTPATPSVSVESEETAGIVMVACGQCQGIGCDFCDGFGHFNRPAIPNPSPAAKSGEAELGALEATLHRILNATPFNTNSKNAKDALDWTNIVAQSAMDDLSRVRAALATPSPQPADAVREVIVAMRDKHGNANGTEYEQGVWDQSQRLLSKLAALTEPAPAGEAVEPVAWRWRHKSSFEDGRPVPWILSQQEISTSEGRVQVEPLFAHPAPEDTALLREDVLDELHWKASQEASGLKASFAADWLAEAGGMYPDRRRAIRAAARSASREATR